MKVHSYLAVGVGEGGAGYGKRTSLHKDIDILLITPQSLPASWWPLWQVNPFSHVLFLADVGDEANFTRRYLPKRNRFRCLIPLIWLDLKHTIFIGIAAGLDRCKECFYLSGCNIRYIMWIVITARHVWCLSHSSVSSVRRRWVYLLSHYPSYCCGEKNKVLSRQFVTDCLTCCSSPLLLFTSYAVFVATPLPPPPQKRRSEYQWAFHCQWTALQRCVSGTDEPLLFFCSPLPFSLFKIQHL